MNWSSGIYSVGSFATRNKYSTQYVGVDSIRIIRGIKAVEGENCHKGPIVGMFSLQAYKLTENKIKDQPKIITVSLDNTMRVWDPTDLSPLQILPNL